MAEMKKQDSSGLYGTRQVAAILALPEWRVKNFTEGAVYGLLPAEQRGKGRGSRRLYAIRDIFRIGIADELLTFGFAPDAVGEAVRKIPDALLTTEIGRATPQPREVPMLVKDVSWRLKKRTDTDLGLTRLLSGEEGCTELFAMNLGRVCKGISEKLYQYWTGYPQGRGKGEHGAR